MQHEITRAIPLLDSEGNLTEPGYAKKLLPVYRRADIKAGNALPLGEIPVGTLVHNVELQPGNGGVLVRTAGAAAQLMAEIDKGWKSAEEGGWLSLEEVESQLGLTDV